MLNIQEVRALLALLNRVTVTGTQEASTVVHLDQKLRAIADALTNPRGAAKNPEEPKTPSSDESSREKA
jgi:hypothetical protein